MESDSASRSSSVMASHCASGMCRSLCGLNILVAIMLLPFCFEFRIWEVPQPLLSPLFLLDHLTVLTVLYLVKACAAHGNRLPSACPQPTLRMPSARLQCADRLEARIGLSGKCYQQSQLDGIPSACPPMVDR